MMQRRNTCIIMFTLGEASFKLSTSRTLNLLLRSRFALKRFFVNREYFETLDDPKITCHLLTTFEGPAESPRFPRGSGDEA